jgi:hypothetical protein
MSLARLTDDPALKRQYVDLAVEFARYIGGKGDLDITTAPVTRAKAILISPLHR